jgi:hypothetical protein
MVLMLGCVERWMGGNELLARAYSELVWIPPEKTTPPCRAPLQRRGNYNSPPLEGQGWFIPLISAQTNF